MNYEWTTGIAVDTVPVTVRLSTEDGGTRIGQFTPRGIRELLALMRDCGTYTGDSEAGEADRAPTGAFVFSLGGELYFEIAVDPHEE